MLYATIMAGGSGTRFWPASRKGNPKQLLNLLGQRSMLQSTVDRLQGLCDRQQMLIVTNRALVDAIAKQLPDIPADSIIGEPAKRDTAPCIGLAAALICAKDSDATMAVMPADHVIQPHDVFRDAIADAVNRVNDDPQQIVTFGIKPTYPAEVFGYIERAETSIDGAGYPTFEVRRFREKPDAETAARFIEAGSFFWNSGIFVWRAQTILDAIANLEPEMFSHLQKIADAIGSDSFGQVLDTEFTAIAGKSIDYAVMERYEKVLVVEAPFQWDDLGNWSALPRLQGVDADGNRIDATHLGIDTRDSIVRGPDGHLLVTVGIHDCIVVNTPDATLIADRNNEEAMRKIVQELERRQWDQYL